MEINLNDENFISEVESFTWNSLYRKEDIHKFIEIVIAEGKEKEFKDLTFASKYICGMMRIVKNSPAISSVGDIDHVKNDLNENMKKAVEQIREIISAGGERRKSYFEEEYLSTTAYSFNNLSQFLSDLEAIKKYINFLKRLD